LTSVRTPSEVPAKEDSAKQDALPRPLTTSKFNDLSVSLAFAITGLAVVYLPDILDKSVDWKVEGRFIGIGLALTGAAFTLLAAEKLTGRSGFGYWGFDILLGTIIAGIMSVIHVYRLPNWSAIILIALAVTLMLIGIYALVSGFTIFFDETGDKASGPGKMPAASEGSSDALGAKEEKRLSWYERITLAIAVISTVATLVAAIEPIVHP
jgi:hypothetical protein